MPSRLPGGQASHEGLHLAGRWGHDDRVGASTSGADIRLISDIDGYPFGVPTRDHTFTELLRSPRAVVADLDDCDVVVHRRDGDDFVIHSLTRHLDEAGGAALVAAMLRGAAPAPAALARALHEVLPWIRFLPDDARAEFASELFETVHAAASLGSFAPVSVVVAQWRHTAEVWADPALLRALRSPIDEPDGRRVTEPSLR